MAASEIPPSSGRCGKSAHADVTIIRESSIKCESVLVFLTSVNHRSGLQFIAVAGLIESIVTLFFYTEILMHARSFQAYFEVLARSSNEGTNLEQAEFI